MKRTLATILGLAAFIAVAGVRAVDIPQIDGETRAKLPGYLGGKGFVTNAQAGVTFTGLTNTGGFFLGGPGVIGTNGTPSTMAVHMATTVSNKFTIVLPPGIQTNNFGGAGTNYWEFASSSLNANGFIGMLRIMKGTTYKGSLGFRDNDLGGLVIEGGGGGSLQMNNTITRFNTTGSAGNTLTMQDGVGVTVSGAGGGANLTVNGSTQLGESGTRLTNITSVTSAAVEWPALAVIGDTGTNYVTASQSVTNRSAVTVTTWPDDPGVIYRATVLTNGTVGVYRTAIVAAPPATNFIRLNVVTYIP